MKPLIAPKHISEFTPDDYHLHVVNMYGVRKKASVKSKSPAPGLSVTRTAKGKLSVRRAKLQRSFDYVTMKEIEGLAKAADCAQSDLWNMFKQREYIIAKDRLEAERIYAEIRGLPWGQ